jgi:hypothetical protein
VSLRISTNATRCPSAPQGKARFRLGKKCVTIEDLVLYRWRQRTRSARTGEIFDGCRLRPNTWRALRLACDAGLSLSANLTRNNLAATSNEMDPKLAETSLILHNLEKKLESGHGGADVLGYMDVAQFAIHRLMDPGGHSMQRLRAEGVGIRTE